MAHPSNRARFRCAPWGKVVTLLGGVVVLLAAFSACVDQPIVALERRNSGNSGGNAGASTGGTSSVGATNSRPDGGTSGFGGFPIGGSNQTADCSSKGEWCDGTAKFPCCGTLACIAGECTNWACKRADDDCSSDSECCMSLECGASGTCGQFVCYKVGETCDNQSQCCSGLCEASAGSTTKTCQSISGCFPLGESCTFNSECCSNECDHSRCASNDRCGSSGEAHCFDKGRSCCSGLVCKNDTQDVPRCVAFNQCSLLGQPCTHDAACCPNSNGSVSCVWNESLHYRECRFSQLNGTGGMSGMSTSTTSECAQENTDCSTLPCCPIVGVSCDFDTSKCLRK